MSKALEVTLVRLPSVAVSLYPVPTFWRFTLLKVAMPLMAATVVVPWSVSLPGLNPVAMARMTLEASVVTTLLNWSSTCTTIAGLMPGRRSLWSAAG